MPQLETFRVMIEDEEDNFIYLDVRAVPSDVDLLLTLINQRSTGTAKIEPQLASREAR